jgi:hypothetical protein
MTRLTRRVYAPLSAGASVQAIAAELNLPPSQGRPRKPRSKPFKNHSSTPQTPLFRPPFLNKNDQIMTNKYTVKTINP